MSTNCVFPPELEDNQLLAYLDDPEANQEIVRHLEKCSYCRERAEALDRLQKRLTTRLYRITCPSPLELGEYHLRLLPASQMLVVAQHVRECPYCTREMAELEGFLGDLVTEDSFAGTAKVLIARLIGGQAGAGKPAVAVRGEAKGPIVFEADGIVVTLDIQSSPNGQLSIQGQVAADDLERWTGALAELRQGDQLEFSTRIDDLGAFQYEGAVHGRKEIRITPQGSDVTILLNFELPT